MELRHLKYFVTVAEELSFRKAADKLRVAQPALSARIKSLESELGIKLLERTTRSVRLTPAGQHFLEDSRSVLTAASHAEHRARNAQLGTVGALRLGVIAPAANPWLAGILRSFHKRFPGIELSLFDLTSTEQLRRLRGRDLDAGLLRPPVEFPELESRPVEESRQVLALHTGHRLATKRLLEWKDFHNESLVLIHPSGQHGYYDPFMEACARAGAFPRAAQYANDIQTKMWLISAGFGIAPTTSTLSQVKRPGLIFRNLPAGLPPVRTILVWRKADNSPALKHLVDSFA